MYLEHPNQDFLDFTYSQYGDPEITKSTIRVPVKEFWVLKGFPEHDQDTYYKHGIVIYEDVVSSVRKIHEYASPERKEFKSEYVIKDGPFSVVEKEAYPCHLSGILEPQNAWIDWEIIAASIRIEG